MRVLGQRYVSFMCIEQNSSLLAILDDDESVQIALQDLIEAEGALGALFRER